MMGGGPGSRTRVFILRWLAVAIIGASILAGILYYASTVDARPPSVSQFGLSQHLPGSGSVALTNASLEIGFSEPVDHESAQASLRIQPSINGAFSWSGTTMTFTPRTRLPLQTTFTVRVVGGVRDRAGNTMTTPSQTFTFQTVGEPRVVASQPTDEAQSVPLSASIQVTFSTLMDTASVERALAVSPQTDVDLKWNGERLTITPRDPLLPGRFYFVTIGSGATDLGGTPMAPEFRLAFVTVPTALSVRTLVPADGTQGVAVTSPIAILFDRALDPGSLNGGMLSIAPSIAGSLAIVAPDGADGLTDRDRSIVRFTPSGPLPANTTFAVTLAAGLRAIDSSVLSRPIRWTFTTGAPSATLSNQIDFLTNRAGIAKLWAMNPDGSNQHQVSAELSPITSYAVSPDGRTFVVGDGARLVQFDADGSDRRVLTESGLLEFDPIYAPDGSQIAFARADAKTGNGLGIWQRPTSGGGAEAIHIASPTPSPSSASGTALPSPSPSPSPSASSTSAPPAPTVPLIRSPRYSPDGGSVAFVDSSGSVGILDLATRRLTTASFMAGSTPVWLPDGSGFLVAGHASSTAAVPSGQTPGTPIPPLSPDGLGLSAIERGTLVVVELATGSTFVRDIVGTTGAADPTVGSDGRVAFLLYDGTLSRGGHLRALAANGIGSLPLAPDTVGLETSAAFGPEPDSLVVARIPTEAATPPGGSPGPSPSPGSSPGESPTATPSPSPTPGPTESPQPSASGSPAPGADQAGPGGIWLMTLDGMARQLTHDGWLPRWLP
jgi:WD40 repeat protein